MKKSFIAKIVEIVYSSYQTTKYVYDPENMNYKMYMGGKEHTDLITKKQYTVKNIITYQVQNSSIQSDRKGRQDACSPIREAGEKAVLRRFNT